MNEDTTQTLLESPKLGATGPKTETDVQSSIYKKLFAVQANIGKLTKDTPNPYFKSKYADLGQTIELLKVELNKAGLVVIQPIRIEDGKNILCTIIYSSNESIESKMILPETAKPQDLGSAITYYRRYALQSLFLLAAEDDDGNTASGAPVTKPITNTVATPATTQVRR